eukprot:356579-Chlamydomonas_euryale.AAC.5
MPVAYRRRTGGVMAAHRRVPAAHRQRTGGVMAAYRRRAAACRRVDGRACNRGAACVRWRRIKAGTCMRRRGAAGPCMRRRGAAGPCMRRRRAAGPCMRRGHAAGPCLRQGHAAGPCLRQGHAAGPCLRQGHAAGPCLRQGHAAGPCMRRRYAAEPHRVGGRRRPDLREKFDRCTQTLTAARAAMSLRARMLGTCRLGACPGGRAQAVLVAGPQQSRLPRRVGGRAGRQLGQAGRQRRQASRAGRQAGQAGRRVRRVSIRAAKCVQWPIFGRGMSPRRGVASAGLLTGGGGH